MTIKLSKNFSKTYNIKDERIFEVFCIRVYRLLYHRVDPHCLVVHAGILGSKGTHEGVVHRESYTLYYVTDGHRMQEMYNEIMRTMPNAFHCIPDRFEKQKMGKKAVKKYPCALQYAPINIITQKMCYEAARIEPLSLACVPD